MTRQQFTGLKVGDIIRHLLHTESLIVTACYGDFVIAVKVQHVSNPSEWDLISQANHQEANRHCGVYDNAENQPR